MERRKGEKQVGIRMRVELLAKLKKFQAHLQRRIDEEFGKGIEIDLSTAVRNLIYNYIGEDGAPKWQKKKN